MSPTLISVRSSPTVATDEALEAVREHLARTRFGSVAMTIHEGRIVQLDLLEKRRFEPARR